jgi:hypothetical protein
MTISSEFLTSLREKILRAMQQQLDALEAAQARDDPRYRPRVLLTRRAVNAMQLWKLCGHSACRRARLCCRDHAQCLAKEHRRAGLSLVAQVLMGKSDGDALLPRKRR